MHFNVFLISKKKNILVIIINNIILHILKLFGQTINIYQFFHDVLSTYLALIKV